MNPGQVDITETDYGITAVHHVDKRGTWASCNRTIYFRHAGATGWHKLGKFPLAFPRDVFAWPRLARRVSRADKANLFPTSSQALLGIRDGKCFSIQDGDARELFKINGDTVLYRSIVELNGALYFGEYFMNPQRRPVRIWRLSSDLGHHEIAYEFAQNTVRHVHGVYADPFVAGRLWVTVGDYENECYILYSDDGFKTIARLGDGSQLWRAVGLLFTENEVIWLTDSHLERNFVVVMDRRECRPTTHQALDSSVWYCASTTDGYYLAATTVEVGPAVLTNQASILISRDGVKWSPALSFLKDRWPCKPFKYGVIGFPSGEFSTESFWIFGEGLVGLDGCAASCTLRKGAG